MLHVAKLKQRICGKWADVVDKPLDSNILEKTLLDSCYESKRIFQNDLMKIYGQHYHNKVSIALF